MSEPPRQNSLGFSTYLTSSGRATKDSFHLAPTLSNPTDSHWVLYPGSPVLNGHSVGPDDYDWLQYIRSTPDPGDVVPPINATPAVSVGAPHSEASPAGLSPAGTSAYLISLAVHTPHIHSPFPRPHAPSFLSPLENHRISATPPSRHCTSFTTHPKLSTSLPPETGVLRIRCRLLTLSRRRCEEWFYVGPNFKATSDYGQHVTTVHGLRSGSWPNKDKGRPEWICTWEGCICVKPRKEENQSRCDGYSEGHAAHTAHPLVHIRSHLPHRYLCEKCGSDLGRESSRKRHEKRDCQARKRLRDSEHEHQTGVICIKSGGERR